MRRKRQFFSTRDASSLTATKCGQFRPVGSGRVGSKVGLIIFRKIPNLRSMLAQLTWKISMVHCKTTVTPLITHSCTKPSIYSSELPWYDPIIKRHFGSSRCTGHQSNISFSYCRANVYLWKATGIKHYCMWRIPIIVDSDVECTPEYLSNTPDVQIPQYTSRIFHNALHCNKNVHTCAHFWYNMVHCGIFVWYIVGFVKLPLGMNGLYVRMVISFINPYFW